MIKHILTLLLSVFIFSHPINIFSSSLDSQEITAIKLVEKIHNRILSYPEMQNWQASVLTTLYEMNKNWEPKKKTIIEKLITVKNKIRKEHILRATEFDNNEIKDKTAKYQAEAIKFNKNNELNQAQGRERKKGRHRGMDLSREELFPFGENRKNDYEFALHEDSWIDKQKAYVLETRSNQKSSDYFEGKYYVHPETFDILRAELRPAKKPGPLRLLEMHIDFARLPEGYLVIEKAKVRIHVGLIIKNIRMESEEIYSDYKFFD